MSIRGVVFFLAVLAHTLILPVRAEADAVPIKVEVVVDVPLVQFLWGPDGVDSAEAAAAVALADLLAQRFRHWTFRTKVDHAKRRVRLYLFEPVTNTVGLRLETDADGAGWETWSAEWLQPGDIQAGYLPPPDKLPMTLVKELDEGLVPDNKLALQAWLQRRVPVARKGQWLGPRAASPEDAIVLSMPASDFADLSGAVFLIMGQVAGGPTTELEARGAQRAAPYPPDARPKQFDGLVVTARRQRAVQGMVPIEPAELASLRRFSLGPVYLKEEDSQLLDDMLLFEE